METLEVVKVSIVLLSNFFCMEVKQTQSEVRDRIRDAAGQMFMRLGIRSVSMDDISVSLGMSKKTLYQHFKDKDELVDAIIVMHNCRIKDDCISCKGRAANAVEEVFLTMDQITEHLGTVNPAIMHDLHKFHFQSFQKFQEIRKEFLFKVTCDNMERGIKEGLYREDINVDVLSKYRLESMMIAFNIEQYPSGKYNLLDVARSILEHWIYGLVTPKGYELIHQYKKQRDNQKAYENR